ncbi:MAG TPA: hypothetical protein VIA06_00395 [Candidatus Dormibacteraeota bacterium]|jgi:hypothetical protein|nr:hypothetical protein [Candidatus Dormibacteraeota bacterium]
MSSNQTAGSEALALRPAPQRLWRALIALCALTLLVGCGSVASASPTTTSTDGDPINIAQAAAVVRQHFDTLAAAMQTKNATQAQDLLGEVDAGPALSGERALVLRYLENGLTANVDTAQAVGSIYLAHQNHYPASFLALAPSPLVDSSGNRDYYVAAYEQKAAGAPWLEVLYSLVGQSSGKLSQVTVGSDGYSVAAPIDQAVGSVTPAALSGAYASYLRDTIAGKPAPAQPPFAAGANTNQYAQSIQQETAYYSSVNVDSKPGYAAYDDYGPFSYTGPGGQVFTLFGTQESYAESTSTGLCMDQPPQQTWFGQSVPAGSYRSVDLQQVDMVGAALTPNAPINLISFTAATTGAQTQPC